MHMKPVEAYLDSLKEKYGVRCCDCIVLKDHEVLLRHMTGNYDFEDSKPLTGDNLHDIFSASKVLTMIGVMQLAEQGKIGLDEPLSRYIPEYAEMRVIEDFALTDFVSGGKFLFGWPGQTEKTVPLESPILIRHLMSMTAGMTYEFHSPSAMKVLERNLHAGTLELARAWAGDPLMYEPGTRYAYSRAHDVLGAVIEAVTGMTFGEYMRQHVFAPCGAENLYYQIPEEKKPLLTDLYAFDMTTQTMKKADSNICRVTDRFESGGGGIASTVTDYAKVLDILANGGVAANGNRILTQVSIDQMRTNQLNEQQLKDFHIGNAKMEYGYGLGVRTLMDPTKSKSPMGEFGWDGAAGAYVLADPENHLAIFYVQAARESGPAFAEIHPTLRDLVYTAIQS